ncbi:YlxR family protein [Corynebacterium marinum]|uniref:YlxR domain-containing protein n=2 Tax=Corynebacterium marinum TaxID=349751 RepID=A0A0B6TMF4_9CORY|nr:YlxR family protein [Corynebacterium marinum]AJK69128.1 hypothetical protein B840_07650 [Corynebacterium marinum DSM 44953]GGO17563.1 DNA-binding protein [Corynebacterium marinum]
MTRTREMRIRTCIATRERKSDTDLLRVVVDSRDESRLLADPSRRLPGRGAWITPDLAALELAEQRHAFGRAFRKSGKNLDTGHVRTYLTAQAAGTDTVRKTEH